MLLLNVVEKAQEWKVELRWSSAQVEGEKKQKLMRWEKRKYAK